MLFHAFQHVYLNVHAKILIMKTSEKWHMKHAFRNIWITKNFGERTKKIDICMWCIFSANEIQQMVSQGSWSFIQKSIKRLCQNIYKEKDKFKCWTKKNWRKNIWKQKINNRTTEKPLCYKWLKNIFLLKL